MGKGSKAAKSRRNFGGIAKFAQVLSTDSNDDEVGHKTLARETITTQSDFADNPAGPSTVRKRAEDAPTDTNIKKRRVGVLPSAWAKYDASHLVTRYDSIAEVPEHLQKCEYA